MSDGSQKRTPMEVLELALIVLPYAEQLGVVEIEPKCCTEAFCRHFLGARVLEPDGVDEIVLLQRADLAVWCAEHIQERSCSSCLEVHRGRPPIRESCRSWPIGFCSGGGRTGH